MRNLRKWVLVGIGKQVCCNSVHICNPRLSHVPACKSWTVVVWGASCFCDIGLWLCAANQVKSVGNVKASVITNLMVSES